MDGWRRGAFSALTSFGAHVTSRTAGLTPGGVIPSSTRLGACTSSDRREPAARAGRLWLGWLGREAGGARGARLREVLVDLLEQALPFRRVRQRRRRLALSLELDRDWRRGVLHLRQHRPQHQVTAGGRGDGIPARFARHRPRRDVLAIRALVAAEGVVERGDGHGAPPPLLAFERTGLVQIVR
eukprot:scaffold15324_cov112-Isochrysis_galbana.AAC.6